MFTASCYRVWDLVHLHLPSRSLQGTKPTHKPAPVQAAWVRGSNCTQVIQTSPNSQRGHCKMVLTELKELWSECSPCFASPPRPSSCPHAAISLPVHVCERFGEKTHRSEQLHKDRSYSHHAALAEPALGAAKKKQQRSKTILMLCSGYLMRAPQGQVAPSCMIRDFTSPTKSSPV